MRVIRVAGLMGLQMYEARFVSLQSFLAFGEQFVKDGWSCGANKDGQPVLFDPDAIPDADQLVKSVVFKDNPLVKFGLTSKFQS